MSSQRELQDHFFREAKRNGYRSRAAYKLIEIDDKKKIFNSGDVVLDLGAAPGSWLQVAAKRVGKHGTVIGVDLKEIEGFESNQITLMQDDVTTLSPESFDGELFDVILSDMAPNTTGTRTIDHHGSVNLCHTALKLSRRLLKPTGNLVMKVLEGEAYKALLDLAATYFESAKGYKPKASRAISTEMYIVCTVKFEEIPPAMQVVPPLPSSGWG